MNCPKIVKQSCEQDLKKLKNVAGVGIGYKWVNGVPTDQTAIIVFVERKIRKGAISKFSAVDMIPEEIDGIPTDVIEVGHITKQTFASKVRPIKPGYSVGHADITCGTIGGFFIDKDGDHVILSNNHVLANENKANIGDLIYQPGPSDAQFTAALLGFNDAPAKLPYFANLKDFVQLTSDNNTQDSAIAKVHPSFIEAGMIDLVYPAVNRPLNGFATAQANMSVQKMGRTSGYTTGRIISDNASFTVSYDFGDATFDDCIVCSAMSKGGDSGSIIFDMDMNAVALLFAGSPKVTIASPILNVVKRYGLQAIKNNIGSISLTDGKWGIIKSTGSLAIEEGQVIISSHANHHCFMRREIGTIQSVEITVNSGSDKGATWGPGLALVWPNHTLKVNLRYSGTFGGSLDNNQVNDIGRVIPNKSYKIRITKLQNTYLGEVCDEGSWHKVIEIPKSVIPAAPTHLIIGKTDEYSSASDFSIAGDIGQCSFSNLSIT